jgi:hypothetical protein
LVTAKQGRVALRWIGHGYCTVLYCTVLYCTVLTVD